jgi:hypothetical protein
MFFVRTMLTMGNSTDPEEFQRTVTSSPKGTPSPLNWPPLNSTARKAPAWSHASPIVPVRHTHSFVAKSQRPFLVAPWEALKLACQHTDSGFASHARWVSGGTRPTEAQLLKSTPMMSKCMFASGLTL